MIEELTPEEHKVAKSIRFEDEMTGWVVVTCGAISILGVGILGWQCFHWLKVAKWIPLTWSDGFIWAGFKPLDLPQARGIEKILEWFGGLPLWTLPIATVFGLCFFWFKQEDDPEHSRVRSKMARIAVQKRPESSARPL